MSNRKTRERVPARSTHRPHTSGKPGVWGIGGLVLGLVLGVLGALVVPGWFSSDSTQDRIAELEAVDAARDVDLTRGLVTLATQARDDVTAMVSFDGTPSAAELSAWRGAVSAAAGRFAERPSGGTAVNLARSGFAGSVTLLERSLDAYPVAPELGAKLRDDAVVAWSVAANQLDLAAVEAGIGHKHVFLPTRGLPGEMHSGHSEDGHP